MLEARGRMLLTVALGLIGAGLLLAVPGAVLAGVLDTVGWLVAITTTFISVDSLQGHNTGQKIAVIVSVSFANFFGTYTGTKLGKKYVHMDGPVVSTHTYTPEGQQEA